MYVVGNWISGCNARTRHIVFIGDGEADFEITETTHVGLGAVTYDIDIMGPVSEYSEHIVSGLKSYEEAAAVVDDILVKSRFSGNRYKYYDVETGKVNGLI
jgi:hypothetical protein